MVMVPVEASAGSRMAVMVPVVLGVNGHWVGVVTLQAPA